MCRFTYEKDLKKSAFWYAKEFFVSAIIRTDDCMEDLDEKDRSDVIM